MGCVSEAVRCKCSAVRIRAMTDFLVGDFISADMKDDEDRNARLE